jgi:hypothetical protein
MRLISIIHPTRSRPERSYNTIKKWREKAGCDLEEIISVDSDDTELAAYVGFFGVRLLVNPNKSAIEAINNAAKVATGDIMIVVSEDSDCPDNWGKKILDVTRGREDWLLSTNDGVQNHRIITMPIMDRKYYNRFGYIYYPEYLHMCADEELTRVGQILGRIIKCDLKFPHLHYSITGEERDEVHKKNDATLEFGRHLFRKRKRKRFYLA